MPEIPLYTSPLTTLRPSEEGISATVQSATHVNRIFTEEAAGKQQVGNLLARGVEGDIKDVGNDAVNYLNYQDKSKVSTAATTGLADIEQKWQQTLKGNGLNPGDPDYVPPADPNDPTVLKKFQDGVIQPFLDTLKKIPVGQVGQDYALAKADELAQHLSTQFNAEASNLAAKGAVLRSTATFNSAANLVQVSPTPDNIDMAVKQVTENMNIEKSGGAVTAEGAAALDLHTQERVKALVHTGIISAVTKSADPAGTASMMLDRYKKYVTPEEETTVSGVAQTVMKAREADAKAQRVEKDAAVKATALSRTSDYVAQFAQDPQNFAIDKMLTDPKYANRPDLLKEGVGVIQTLREVKEKLADVDPLTSKANALGLLQRMDLPEGDPRRLTDRSEIDQQFIAKNIGKTEWTELTGRLAKDAEGVDKQVASARTRFFNDNRPTINPQDSAPGKDMEFRAQQEAIRMEGFVRGKGGDPASVYDPSSPNYFGRQLSRFTLGAHGALPQDSGYTIQDPMISQAASVIKNNIESGGDYGAIGKTTASGDKAYGAYQVMGANVGTWTKQYYGRTLSPQEFLDNKEAQDMVFEGQFGKYAKQYGAEGAARAWYAGEKGMHNPNATDVNGKLTVEQYGRKFMAGIQGLPFVSSSTNPTDLLNKYPGKRIMRDDGTIWTVPTPPSVPMSK